MMASENPTWVGRLLASDDTPFGDDDVYHVGQKAYSRAFTVNVAIGVADDVVEYLEREGASVQSREEIHPTGLGGDNTPFVRLKGEVSE